MSPWVTCPECYHPGWAHPRAKDLDLMALWRRPVGFTECIGTGCHCTRLTT